MEVQVTDTFGLEEDVIVSIRCGSVRRQAPLESVKSHPFKFQAQLEDVSEPLKIDLLKPVASTRLVLHPAEEQYSIGFEQDDCIAMGLHVMAGAPEASESTTGGAKDTGAKDSASSAKDYLEQNGLLKYVQSLLQAIIQDKPEDPFSYMIEQLSAAQSASIACERAMSRPTSAMRRPTALAGSGPASARQTPPKQKMVAQSPAPNEEVPLPSQLVDDMPAEPSPGTPVAVPAKPVQTTRPEEEEALRENIRAKVKQSLTNGVLEQGLVTLQRKKSQEPSGSAAPATAAPAQPEQPAPKSPTAEQEDLEKQLQELDEALLQQKVKLQEEAFQESLEKLSQKFRESFQPEVAKLPQQRLRPQVWFEEVTEQHVPVASSRGGMSRPITTDQRPRGNGRPTPPKQDQVAPAPAPSKDAPSIPAEPTVHAKLDAVQESWAR